MPIPLPNVPDWSTFESRYSELAGAAPTESTVDGWLRSWSDVASELDELARRLEVASSQDTTNAEAQKRYHLFLEAIFPRWKAAENDLRRVLLKSGVAPPRFQVPLRKMRADAALFRDVNAPLLGEERALGDRYSGISGSWNALWEGRRTPLPEVRRHLRDPDRSIRERAFHASIEPVAESRHQIEALWSACVRLRLRLAANAGLPDYRTYRWQQLQRFDYTPDDCKRFHAAVQEVVVPVVGRLNAERKRRLGVETLRPWDLTVDPLGRPPLQPFNNADEAAARTAALFHRMDPQLGDLFSSMQRDDLLDLDSRLNKAGGGYCLPFNRVRKPFIFLSLVGTHRSLEGLVHESGHAFHVFLSSGWPYLQQRDIETIGSEFAEVGSMAMELLTNPWMARGDERFYTPAEAERALGETLHSMLSIWCSFVTIDAFQHWIYENPHQAVSIEAAGRAYADTYRRFHPDVDWTGLESQLEAGWWAVEHIFQDPFYYIEYGLAQLGVVQIWTQARRDPVFALQRYKAALALGDTRSVPDLFRAAGARLAFDAGTLREAVVEMEGCLAEIDRSLSA